MTSSRANSPATRKTLAIDPFGFWPNYSSRIEGLGGSEAPQQGDYAFHSPYVHSGGGSLVFHLRFDRLAASIGSLVVKIHRLRASSTNRVQTVHTQTVPFHDLLAHDGNLSIDIPTVDGDSYAIIGHVDGNSDASASALFIDADHSDDRSSYSALLKDNRDGIFGERATRRARRYVSQAPATLANPVSQLCTSSQFDEPVYAGWVERMRLGAKHIHRKQWEFVYILQVLEHFGAIREGARGLGFGVGLERLPAVLAASGCHVVGTDLPTSDSRAATWSTGNQHSDSLKGLRYPEICPDSLFDERVGFREVDMNTIPADLSGFDFSWSSCAFEHLGSIAAGLRFVENSLACVKPGGIVVHTTELNLSSNRRTVDHAETVLFRRRDMEKLAARLTSLGHDVAPLKYDAGDGYADNYVDVPPYTGDAQLKIALSGYVTTSFGIVVRKGQGTRSGPARWFRR